MDEALDSSECFIEKCSKAKMNVFSDTFLSDKKLPSHEFCSIDTDLNFISEIFK